TSVWRRHRRRARSSSQQLPQWSNVGRTPVHRQVPFSGPLRHTWHRGSALPRAHIKVSRTYLPLSGYHRTKVDAPPIVTDQGAATTYWLALIVKKYESGYSRDAKVVCR